MPTPVPTFGTIEGTIVGVSPASIHGDIYYDVLILPFGSPLAEHLSEAAIRDASCHARIPSHLLGGGPIPSPGDRVRLTILLGQVQGYARVGAG